METPVLELGKEMDVEQARPDSSVWEEEIQMMKGITAGTGLGLVVPPTPPAKDMKVLPALTRPQPLHLNTDSRPSTSGSEISKAPRPLPLRAPLGMNPPTRPGTATTETSRVEFAPTTQMRVVGSNKRLSWSSFATSKRQIKYGKGRFSNVELSPQPSDDPEDPLVSHYHLLRYLSMLIVSRTGHSGERS
jgi:hypothetical protein